MFRHEENLELAGWIRWEKSLTLKKQHTNISQYSVNANLLRALSKVFETID